MTGNGGKDQARKGRHNVLALSLAGLVAGMVGLSFAAVPLYQMFCQATGYGGVPRKADASPDKILDRTMRIRFDANVAKGMPWTFKPVEHLIEVKIGETTLAFFKATNDTDRPVSGTATFNVVPEAAGRYFAKIECFCFKQQTLAANASVEMPVTFFVDPKIVEDENTKNITEITLSYTFFRDDKDPGLAAVPQGSSSGS